MIRVAEKDQAKNRDGIPRRLERGISPKLVRRIPQPFFYLVMAPRHITSVHQCDMRSGADAKSVNLTMIFADGNRKKRGQATGERQQAIGGRRQLPRFENSQNVEITIQKILGSRGQGLLVLDDDPGVGVSLRNGFLLLL